MLLIELQLLLLILVANGTPVVATALLKARGAWPLDGGLLWRDGHRLLGRSKTWRGVLCALTTTTIVAWLLGFPPYTGLVIAAFAMLGDVLSSFSKRRLRLAPSSMALGLDQIPESLLPLLAMQAGFGLSWLHILEIVTAFIILELLLSRILYWLRIRNRPY